MRNPIQNAGDVKKELKRLKALRSQQELQIKASIAELQDTMQPVNIIKGAFENVTSKFSGISSFTDGIKLGLDLISKKEYSKNAPNPIYQWIARLLVFNIIKGTQGEKKFDWHLFLNGLGHDLMNAETQTEDDVDTNDED